MGFQKPALGGGWSAVYIETNVDTEVRQETAAGTSNQGGLDWSEPRRVVLKGQSLSSPLERMPHPASEEREARKG